MLILLVGPKGSGKSHVGRLLEARLGVHLFHVEPHWMRYHAECAEADRPVSIPEGIERVRPHPHPPIPPPEPADSLVSRRGC